MATKKKPGSSPKPKVKEKPAQPGKLTNLAARPSFSEIDDEQLVDHSGVFRVTSSIAQAQTGHQEDDDKPRFANDSLVMAAQRDNFRDDGVTLDDVVEEKVAEDESTAALRRERLATLAARAQARTRPRR